MIHYALICHEGHEFEGWFRDSAAYDAQAAEGDVACPYCQSIQVGRAVMSPHVARRAAPRAGEACERRAAEPANDLRSARLLDERHAQLRTMIRELRETIVASTEDVGARFPREAREIRDGDARPRPIRGRATLKEARSLLEEGIEIMPFPGPQGEGN